MALPTTRQGFGLIFLFCCGLMATGYYMQFAMNMEPCALCMTQRFFITLSGVLALIACAVNPARVGVLVSALLVATSSLVGSYFSSRQIWLQSLPEDQVPACGPGIGYILETFPLMKALEVLLKGDGNCAEVSWSFLGLSIPSWTLFAFIMIVGACVYLVFKDKHERNT